MKISDIVSAKGINRDAVKKCLRLLGAQPGQTDFSDEQVNLVEVIYKKSKAEGLTYEEALKQLQGIHGFNNSKAQDVNTASQQTAPNALGLQVQDRQFVNFVNQNARKVAIAAHAAYPRMLMEQMAQVTQSPEYSPMIEEAWAELEAEIIQDPSQTVQLFLSGYSNEYSDVPLLLAGSEEN